MSRAYTDAVVVGTLVAVAIVAVALGVAVGRSGRPNPIDRTTITLNQTAGNKESCQPNDVGMLSQYQGDPVKWDIVNNCSDAYFVTVDNFKLRDPQNGNAPANQST